MNDTPKPDMSERTEALQQILEQQFGAMGCTLVRALDELTMEVPVDKWSEVALQLRDDEPLQFDQMIDVCGVDYSAYGSTEWETDNASATGYGRGVEPESVDQASEKRFAAVYHLLSVALNNRLRVRIFLDTAEPIVDSVVSVWEGVDWFEREAFDMYGILFSGHPDLRRILTDYGFVGHPFRKDFPLEGHVEMRYDPEQGRVIYEPVKLESRVLVPKVIRKDNRFIDEAGQQQDTSDA